MKKFWIVLLALGLVAGFAMSASAADVKFSGQYYLAGIYADNNSLTEEATRATSSQALYYQRLRIQTTFKVAEGLALVTRFDALEKKWGEGTVAGGAWRLSNAYDVTNRPSTGAAGRRVQENIEFERAYLDFTTRIGRFNIGYQNFVAWGTMFADTHITRPGIKYFVPVGPLTVVAAIEKTVDQNTGAGTTSDADNNIYDIGAIYKFGAGEAGLLFQYGDTRQNRPGVAGYRTQLNIFNPYTKLKFGPVYVEAEGAYGFGDLVKFDNLPGATNVSAEALALYLHAKADLGPAYVGGMFIYIRGDDWTTTDKVEGSMMTALLAGDAFNPCLMLWSGEYTTWVSNFAGNATGSNPWTGASNGITTYLDNMWFYQLYAGFKPVAKADLMASVTYAYADKKPRPGGIEYVGDTYGTEIDLTFKYKLFDNLEYMIGGAYLFAGNYFKGTNDAFKVKDNYLLMHKLTLNF